MRKLFFISFIFLFILILFNCPIPQKRSGEGGDSDGDEENDKVVAKIQVYRIITKLDQTTTKTQDFFSTKFGEDIDDYEIISPLRAGSVVCNDLENNTYSLPWDDSIEGYLYTALSFIEYNENYTFVVVPSIKVPLLVKSIVFPNYDPDITSPIPGQVINKTNDFTIEWDGDSIGSVIIRLSVDSVNIGFDLETDNDGIEVISSAQMNTLPDGECTILIETRNHDMISSSLFDDRSFILARSICKTYINLE